MHSLTGALEAGAVVIVLGVALGLVTYPLRARAARSHSRYIALREIAPMIAGRLIDSPYLTDKVYGARRSWISFQASVILTPFVLVLAVLGRRSPSADWMASEHVVILALTFTPIIYATSVAYFMLYDLESSVGGSFWRKLPSTVRPEFHVPALQAIGPAVGYVGIGISTIYYSGLTNTYFALLLLAGQHILFAIAARKIARRTFRVTEEEVRLSRSYQTDLLLRRMNGRGFYENSRVSVENDPLTTLEAAQRLSAKEGPRSAKTPNSKSTSKTGVANPSSGKSRSRQSDTTSGGPKRRPSQGWRQALAVTTVGSASSIAINLATSDSPNPLAWIAVVVLTLTAAALSRRIPE